MEYIFVYLKSKEEHENHLMIMLSLLKEKQLYAKFYVWVLVIFRVLYGACCLK